MPRNFPEYPLKKGSSPTLLSATLANKILCYLEGLSNLEGRNGITIKKSFANWVIDIDDNVFSDAVATASISVQRYRVKTINSSSLSCRTYDGTNEGGDLIEVAMPPSLRGQTATLVLPQYVVNGEIFATTPVGGSGVVDVTWQDVNVDARVLGVEVDVCVNGLAKKRVVNAGPVYDPP